MIISVLPIHLLRTGNGQHVCRTSDSFPAPIQDMSIDHHCANLIVPQQFLNRSNIISLFQQMRGKRMTKRMAEEYGSSCSNVSIVPVVPHVQDVLEGLDGFGLLYFGPRIPLRLRWLIRCLNHC
jgi:hypothetical protein